MQSLSENQREQDLDNQEYDSTKILEMNTFAEFKNYQTESVILNHLKKLHDNTNEKIFKIFYDYFVYKYPDENVNYEQSSNESPILNRNIQRTKTKLRGMLLKKNDDGILSFLFIREEFEKLIKEKEDMIENLTKTNKQIEEKIRSYDKNSIDSERKLSDLKKQLNKSEAELKVDFLLNLESESKYKILNF